MNRVKFYKPDGKGGLVCAVVSVAMKLTTDSKLTLPRVEGVMARLGFKRKRGLTPEQRRLIPVGGMAGVRTLQKLRTKLSIEPETVPAPAGPDPEFAPGV